MARYLLSALVTPFDRSEVEAVFHLKRMNLEEAREWVKEGEFTSAVGHASTAELLSRLLGVSVPVNRVTVYLRPGDEALCIQFFERVAEGRVLSLEELERWYDDGKLAFVLVRRVR